MFALVEAERNLKNVMVRRNEQITEVVVLADCLKEQSFLDDDQDATPVVALDSNLEGFDAFNERIQGLSIPDLIDSKDILLEATTRLQADLPENQIELNDWHEELFRMIELTQSKLLAVSNLISERSKT